MSERRLTKLCERVTPRMLENAALDANASKRSTVVYLIVSLAASDFWKYTKRIKDNPNWGVSESPFDTTNSDVIVAEALMFFWYNFFIFARHAVTKRELNEADIQAVSTAGTTIGHVIQETTQWSISEILRARIDEYEHRDSSENPTEVFSRIVLRSTGKQAIHDPDCRLGPLNSLDHTPIVMRTMIYITAMLPKYFEVYRNIVSHYPMD